MAAATVVLVLVTIFYSQRSDKRTEALFKADHTALLDVTPIAIMPTKDSTGADFATTFISLVNYSGFDAYNVGVDLKYYETGGWISEWVKADQDSLKLGRSNSVTANNKYMSQPIAEIAKIPAGATAKLKDTGEDLYLSGALNLDAVCAEEAKGIPVFIRVTWRNEEQHVFDQVHKYTLICTRNSGRPDTKGRAFTFIPNGITNQKGQV